MQVGRGELDASVEHVEEVVGDDAFHHVVVAEAQADPEAVELGAAEEGFALGNELVGEFADEVDGFNSVEGEGAVLAVGGQEVNRLGAAERRGVEVAADRGVVEQEDDDFLVRRGSNAAFCG